MQFDHRKIVGSASAHKNPKYPYNFVPSGASDLIQKFCRHIFPITIDSPEAFVDNYQYYFEVEEQAMVDTELTMADLTWLYWRVARYEVELTISGSATGEYLSNTNSPVDSITLTGETSFTYTTYSPHPDGGFVATGSNTVNFSGTMVYTKEEVIHRYPDFDGEFSDETIYYYNTRKDDGRHSQSVGVKFEKTSETASQLTDVSSFPTTQNLGFFGDEDPESTVNVVGTVSGTYTYNDGTGTRTTIINIAVEDTISNVLVGDVVSLSSNYPTTVKYPLFRAFPDAYFSTSADDPTIIDPDWSQEIKNPMVIDYESELFSIGEVVDSSPAGQDYLNSFMYNELRQASVKTVDYLYTLAKGTSEDIPNPSDPSLPPLKYLHDRYFAFSYPQIDCPILLSDVFFGGSVSAAIRLKFVTDLPYISFDPDPSPWNNRKAISGDVLDGDYSAFRYTLLTTYNAGILPGIDFSHVPLDPVTRDLNVNPDATVEYKGIIEINGKDKQFSYWSGPNRRVGHDDHFYENTLKISAISIRPKKYFEYRNSQGLPVYNSTTGARLRDPKS